MTASPAASRIGLGAIVRAGLSSLVDVRMAAAVAVPTVAATTLIDLVEWSIGDSWLITAVNETVFVLASLVWQRHLLLGSAARWPVETNEAAREPFASVVVPYLATGALFWLLILGLVIFGTEFGVDFESLLVLYALAASPLVMLLLTGRLLPVFPARATGHRLSLRQAWRLSGTTGYRLGAVVGLFGFLPVIPYVVLDLWARETLVGGLSPAVAALLDSLVTQGSRALGALAGAASIAFVWRSLTVPVADVSAFD